MRDRRAQATGIGALCGLAWAGALRSYMSELGGAESSVSWVDTFVGILLPGAVAGALLGAAAATEPIGRGRTALRWYAAAPLVLAIIPMLLPGQLVALFTTGLGGGAVGVPLGGLAGGYVLGGRRRWARISCMPLSLLILVGVPAAVPALSPVRLGLRTPRGTWVMLLAATLILYTIYLRLASDGEART